MIALFLLCSLALHATIAREAHSSVQYDALRKLHFFADSMTTGRRNAPVPQLEQLGGHIQPFEAATCTRSSASSPWQCTAVFRPGSPSEYRHLQFDVLDVQCEGFDWPDDPDVLVGSCALRYSFADEGESIGACCMPDDSETTTTTVEETVTTTTRAAPRTAGEWLDIIVVLLVVIAVFRCLCQGEPTGRVHIVHPPPSPPPSYSRATRTTHVYHDETPAQIHHHHRTAPVYAYTGASSVRSTGPQTTTTTTTRRTTTQAAGNQSRGPRPRTSSSVSGTATSSRR